MGYGGAQPIESARILGAALLAGGLLAGVSVALPPAAVESETAVIAVGALALVLGALLLRAQRCPSQLWLGALTALGTVLITVSTWAGGPDTGTGANEILYIWISLYAFYFLSMPHALGQLGFIGLAYGWLLSDQGLAVDVAMNQWVITISTLLVSGLLVVKLRGSIRGMVSELNQRARYDGLTGLLNRQEFEERGSLELARQRRDGSEMALIAVDLDKFKALNDNHGHPAGDRVLRRISRVLDSETRRIDAVARVGGDEFLVLLPGTGEKDARQIAERLLYCVRLSSGEGPDAFTASLGLAISGPEAANLLGLWAAADEALYAAKRSGGDRIAIARAQRPRATDTVATH